MATRTIVDSVPRVSTEGRQAREPVAAGDLPSPIDPPSGCRFRTRCPRATEVCEAFVPEIRRIDEDHYVACHFPVTPSAAEPAVADGPEGTPT